MKKYLFKYVFSFYIISSFSVISCVDKQVISESEFAQKTWKDDEKACLGERKILIDSLLKIKDKFLGYNDLEVRKILGKPDEVELAERSKKYYYYFYTKGSQCEGDTSNIKGKMLQIRFNSTNQVNELTLKK
jgi:outer membrane protein assembly factor BamE (lipoprotein component of BamABCDE complex)